MSRKRKNPKPTASARKQVARTESGTEVALAKNPAGPRAWAAFWLVLAGTMALILFHAFTVDSVTTRLCDAVDGPNLKPQERMPVFLAPMALDGYVWDRHAEHLGENGELRLRFSDLDNAPIGREVHWNSAFAWYLRGLGEIYRSATGDTLRNSIFRMSIWANPILLVIGIAFLSILSARRFGPMCGAILAFGMVFTPTFYEGFLPAYPDHHGLIAFAILCQVFGIAWAGAGWVQAASGSAFVPPRALAQARHGMIFSAISGAAGLWISAFSTAVVTGGIGIGVVLANLFFSRRARSAGCVFHAELWKLWAWVGALGSLGFYILEYFPNHLGMRLEVNHPFYALAWLGGGWGVATLAGWVEGRGIRKEPFPLATLALCGAACAVLPLTLAFGGPAVYIPRDPFMGRLWQNIAELLPLLVRLQTGTLTWATAFGFFPIFVIAGVALLLSKRINGGDKPALLFLITPILTTTAMQFFQTRWGMLAGPLYIGLASIVLPLGAGLFARHLASRIVGGIAVAVVAGLIAFPVANDFIRPPVTQFFMNNRRALDPNQALHLLHRDMARIILKDSGGKPGVVLSSPNSSCLLSTLGGFQTIGTLYWENVDGLKMAARMLNAQSEDEALKLLKERGVQYITFMPWENFMEPYFRLLAPDPSLGQSFSKSFGNNVFFGHKLPVWLRPIPYPPNDLSQAIGQQVLIAKVVPDQTPDEAKYYLGRYQRISERDPVAAEITFRDIIDRAPESGVVRLELADLYVEQKRYPEAAAQYKATLEHAPAGAREKIALDAGRRLASAGALPQAVDVVSAAAAMPDATAQTVLSAAWALATAPDAGVRNGPKALELSKNAPVGSNPTLLGAIHAAALAAEGKFDEAIAAADSLAKTAEAASDANARDLAARMKNAFTAKQPWIDGN